MLARIILVITFFTVIVLPSSSQVSIIPEPVSLQQKEGNYNLKANYRQWEPRMLLSKKSPIG